MPLVTKAPSGSGKVIPVAYPPSPGTVSSDIPIAKQQTPTRRRKTKNIDTPAVPLEITKKGKSPRRVVVSQPIEVEPPEELETSEPVSEDFEEETAGQDTVQPEGDTVDDILERNHYKIVSRLLSQPNSEAPKGAGQLVEVSNEYGQKAFVELGSDYLMPVKAEDLLLRETTTELPIDVSEKNGLLSSLGMDVAGVAIVCQNGVCTLHKSQGPVEELHYAYEGLQNTSPNNELGLTVSYPIIRLSDIEKNPEQVLKQTDKAFSVLRKVELARQKSERDRIDNVLSKVQKEFTEYQAAYKKAEQELSESIRCLKILLETEDNGSTDYHKQLLYNFKRRYQLIDDLLALGQMINVEVSELETLAQQLSRLTKDIQDKFANVNYMLEL